MNLSPRGSPPINRGEPRSRQRATNCAAASPITPYEAGRHLDRETFTGNATALLHLTEMLARAPIGHQIIVGWPGSGTSNRPDVECSEFDVEVDVAP